MLNVRNADASRFQYPGPLRKFGPKFPNSGNPPFSAPGCAKHWVVTRAPLAAADRIFKPGIAGTSAMQDGNRSGSEPVQGVFVVRGLQDGGTRAGHEVDRCSRRNLENTVELPPAEHGNHDPGLQVLLALSEGQFVDIALG